MPVPAPPRVRANWWQISLLAIAIAFSALGLANAYITVATNDPHLYAPYVRHAFYWLGASQAAWIVLLVFGRKWWRWIAVAGLLFNCRALYDNYVHAQFVFS